MKCIKLWSFLAAAVMCGQVNAAHAEVNTVRVARLYGFQYLQLMVMEKNHLIEKEAKKRGINNLAVKWSKFAGGNVMNDALLSGSLNFGAGGLTTGIILWGKTRNTVGVKAVSGLNFMPMYLNTCDPKVKTLKDFTAKDKIALPAVKSSPQAVALEMAATRSYGLSNHGKYTPLTVSLSHPDAMISVLSCSGEINSHFASPPYQDEELMKPSIHKVFSTYDLTGGDKGSIALVWTTKKFHDENPKVTAAFEAALQDATDFINKDKRAAAQVYLDMTHEKASVDQYTKLLNNPALAFTLAPRHVMNWVDFMNKVGMIKSPARSWKDLFFPEAYRYSGS